MDEENNNVAMVNIVYKNYKFNVELTSILNTDIIVGELRNNEETTVQEHTIIQRFKSDIYFQKFSGEIIPNTTMDKVHVSIKREFRKFVMEYESENAQVEEVEIEVLEDSENPQNEIDKIIFNTVSRALGSKNNYNMLDSMIKLIMKENGVVPFRTILELKKPNGKTKDLGIQHRAYERILKTISAGVNIALVGPAGSGKTTIVYNVAEALGLTFASQSVSAQSTVFDFFGYKNAKGEYVPTLFREKYEKGGVFLLDEFDAGNPNVLAALNQATANGYCPFPDKMVEKHKDFVIVMAGNTFGTGATIEYVGRNKIDAATLDRFAFIYIDYDETLERALSSNDEWCTRVQRYRSIAIQKKIRTIISPRATFNGEKLLAVGLSQREVEEMTIFKGLSTDERNLLTI